MNSYKRLTFSVFELLGLASKDFLCQSKQWWCRLAFLDKLKKFYDKISHCAMPCSTYKHSRPYRPCSLPKLGLGMPKIPISMMMASVLASKFCAVSSIGNCTAFLIKIGWWQVIILWGYCYRWRPSPPWNNSPNLVQKC